MTVLITGAGGMMGSHLAESMLSDKKEILATYFMPTINMLTVDKKINFQELDVTNKDAVFDCIAKNKPKEIYHLAAQSLPTVSWIDPWNTMKINIDGTVNIFEAILSVKKIDKNYDPMTVIACSSAEYGASLTPDRIPITEDAPLLPLHPYGVSKVGQDLLGYQYFYNHGLRCIRARIFNCTGPRKRNDVVSDFGRAIVKAMYEGLPVKHGNLETMRAIIDVRDMVSALIDLARKGRAGEAYNICADKAFRISDIMEMYFEVVGQRFDTEIDPSLLRPSDEPIIFGDTRKIRDETNWSPKYDLRQTISDVLNFEKEQYCNAH